MAPRRLPQPPLTDALTTMLRRSTATCSTGRLVARLAAAPRLLEQSQPVHLNRAGRLTYASRPVAVIGTLTIDALQGIIGHERKRRTGTGQSVASLF